MRGNEMTFKEWYLKWWKRVPKPIRQFINKIDDPIDWVKEWFYNNGKGRVIWKWHIYFDCIIMSKPGTCRIVRIK